MKRNCHNARGFSLIEVVLALGITVFALIIILGLLPVGLSTSRVSLQQTEAINLATAIVADLRQTPTAAEITASASLTTPLTSLSPRYKIDVTQPSTTFYLDPNGSNSGTAPFTTLTPTSRYKVSITLTQPTGGLRTATYGSVILSWPAAAATPLNSVTAFIALDRN